MFGSKSLDGDVASPVLATMEVSILSGSSNGRSFSPSAYERLCNVGSERCLTVSVCADTPRTIGDKWFWVIS